jgi:hypothetical protein
MLRCHDMKYVTCRVHVWTVSWRVAAGMVVVVRVWPARRVWPLQQ